MEVRLPRIVLAIYPPSMQRFHHLFAGRIIEALFVFFEVGGRFRRGVAKLIGRIPTTKRSVSGARGPSASGTR